MGETGMALLHRSNKNNLQLLTKFNSWIIWMREILQSSS
ncbi:hypothetical protein wTpre_343 [Wolbachia endosymbiont of Trichogramma pretiosum]|nr:hypothetical protein wTpre_343 [Wolbachia endosymbiont of Trichogramma pretiosum]